MRALTVALSLAVFSLGPSAHAADTPRVADLTWLEGRWSGVKDGTASEEHWTSPEGGGLVGMHKDVKAGRMTGFEFLRIGTTKEGTIVYMASPQGRPATPFTLVEAAGKRLVFENKEHDFPQRVLYWLDDAGSLHARIEGTTQGKAMHEEWVWTRKQPAP